MIDTTLPARGQLKPGQLSAVWKSDLIPVRRSASAMISHRT